MVNPPHWHCVFSELSTATPVHASASDELASFLGAAAPSVEGVSWIVSGPLHPPKRDTGSTNAETADPKRRCVTCLLAAVTTDAVRSSDFRKNTCAVAKWNARDSDGGQCREKQVGHRDPARLGRARSARRSEILPHPHGKRGPVPHVLPGLQQASAMAPPGNRHILLIVAIAIGNVARDKDGRIGQQIRASLPIGGGLHLREKIGHLLELPCGNRD